MNREGGQMKRSSVQWVVKKKVFTDEKTKRARTVTFEVGIDYTNWCLKLKPRIHQDGDILVGLKLVLRSDPFGPIWTKYKLGLITKDGKEANVKYAHHIFRRKWDNGLLNFIKLDSLLDEKNNFFKKDKLVIFCDIEACKIVEVPETPLVRGQRRLLESGDFSDFTLVVEGEELNVHTKMLSKSPVFRAMLEHDMKEKKSGRVEIIGLNVVGVKGLLEFLYTGKVNELEKIGEEVLIAADRYGVDELKTLCEQQLYCELRPGNAVELLEFGTF